MEPCVHLRKELIVDPPSAGCIIGQHNPTLLLTKGVGRFSALAPQLLVSHLFLPFAAELCRYVQRTESPLNGLDH